MQLSKGFEQGIYVVLILQIKGQGKALKSSFLSKELEVSDSSLKKILRKLVVAKIIKSVASKDGGFELARPIEKISMNDVLLAIEGNKPIVFKNHHLAKEIFSNNEHTKRSEEKVETVLRQAEIAYEDELKRLTLDQLLEVKKRFSN